MRLPLEAAPVALVFVLATGPAPASACEPYPEVEKAMVLPLILNRPLVRDAAISQDGCRLSLVVLVNEAANETYARETGDDFVRLVKGFAPGAPGPGREIGPGVYSYTVGVYAWPSKRTIAIGAKSAFARSIRW